MPNFCKCGCGKVPKKNDSLYISGHNARVSNPMLGVHPWTFGRKHSKRTKDLMKKKANNEMN